jgi:hypothetical protein
MDLTLQSAAPAVTRRKEKPAPAVTRRKEKPAPAYTRRKEYVQTTFGHIFS